MTRETVPAWRHIWPIVRFFQRHADPDRAGAACEAVAIAPAEAISGKYFDGRVYVVRAARVGWLGELHSLMPILLDRSYKANLAKLISGGIYHVAEVVRNHSLRGEGERLLGG